MIRNSLTACSKLIQACSFSTQQLKDEEILNTGTYGTKAQQGYLAEDAQRVFQQFFKENPLAASQMSFFDMNNTSNQKTEEFDPYKTLGIQKSANKETIKSAYRQLAMKYHPKKDSSLQAAEKFINISRAFDILNENEAGNKNRTVSFAQEFQNSMKDLLTSEMGLSKNVFKDANMIKNVELVSESRKSRTIGNSKEVTVEKEYNRNGRLLKFTRVEKHHQNGSIEVAEELDNGYEIKSQTLNF